MRQMRENRMRTQFAKYLVRSYILRKRKESGMEKMQSHVMSTSFCLPLEKWPSTESSHELFFKNSGVKQTRACPEFELDVWGMLMMAHILLTINALSRNTSNSLVASPFTDFVYEIMLVSRGGIH